MSRYKGFNGYAEAGGTEIGERVSFDLEQSVAELTADTMGNTSTDTDAGLESWSGTIEVFRDPTDAGQTAMAVGSTVALTLYPEGNSTGMEVVTGNFLITKASITVPVGDLVKNSYSIKNKGDVTITAVP